MNDITLLQPAWLWLALPALPLIFLLGMRLRGLARWRRRAALLLQSLTVLLMLGSLAQPVRVLPDENLSLVVVLDASASLSAASRQSAVGMAQALLAEAAPTDIVRFVAAGQRAVALTPEEVASGEWATEDAGTGEAPVQNPKLALERSEGSKIQNSTDIASGLRLAGSLLPDLGRRRVALLSDGWETQGQAADEAARLAARGIDLQVIPLGALGDTEVIVQRLSLPQYARVGDPVGSEVSVYSTLPTQATLQVSVDGGPPSSRNITLKAGTNAVPLEQKAETPGFHRIDVRLVTRTDTSDENNTASATLVVKPEPRVLIVEDRPGEARFLQDALEERQMSVEVLASSGIPSSAAGLDAYDSVIMNNVAATSLTLDQQKTIQEYVRRNGHGLVVVGGETSYAKGGYPESVFEEMLPVSSKPAPRPEQGANALIIVLDRSGSMMMHEGVDSRDDASKFEMAQEAARLAVDAMRDGDTLGVMIFDDEHEWTVPVQIIDGPEDKTRAKTLISSIESRGGTSIHPALRDAAEAMRSVKPRNKHIVLVSDGQEFDAPAYEPLLDEMRDDNISLSTIAIGTSSDTVLLTRLAKLGQGRYYFTERPRNIPKVIFEELTLALNEATIEGQVQPQLSAPSPVLRGFAPQDLPRLAGYDITTAKDEAVVALVSDQGDPLLSHWNYGLGRVVAFTSEAGEGWGERWLNWEEFGRFWSGAVRWTMASPVNRQLQPSISVQDAGVENSARSEFGVAQIAVESLNPDNSFADLVDVTASIRGASGVVTTTVLAQTAPGHFEAAVPLAEAGAYEVLLRRGGGDAAVTESAGFSVPPSAELLHAGTNDRLLKRLNGGRDYLTDLSAALNRDNLAGASPNSEALWPYLLAPALLLLLLSVAVRRVDFRVRRSPR